MAQALTHMCICLHRAARCALLSLLFIISFLARAAGCAATSESLDRCTWPRARSTSTVCCGAARRPLISAPSNVIVAQYNVVGREQWREGESARRTYISEIGG